MHFIPMAHFFFVIESLYLLIFSTYFSHLFKLSQFYYIFKKIHPKKHEAQIILF